ncbi:MAG: hypothetical protein Ct9H300mP29_8600 [Candidatus Neomarinimicrobiota bacterium]|nr:MAG: hypothetical protein Ct9H300mP29_8600 [Candidatus Neomarinimicrobiota bacterium]
MLHNVAPVAGRISMERKMGRFNSLLCQMLLVPMDTNPRDYIGVAIGRGSTLWLDDSRVFPFVLNQFHWIGSKKNETNPKNITIFFNFFGNMATLGNRMV